MVEEACFQRNPDFIHRRIVDESVLVPIHKNIADMNAIYVLNPVGDFIWEQLVESSTKEELISAVMEAFDADAEIVESDVDKFLQDLTSIGAIRSQ